MLNKSQIHEIIYRAIDRVNEVSLDENAIAKDSDTILLGDGASLDSMGFVNFVVALEEEFATQTGCHLDLVELLNFTSDNKPQVHTVGELIDLLSEQSSAEPQPQLDFSSVSTRLL